MALIFIGLACRESAASPSLAVKDLMLSELSAIRRDVGQDRWSSATSRAAELNSYWIKYRKTHAVKENTNTSFYRHYNNLRAHLRERSKIKVYADLTALRSIITILKA